MVLGFNPMSDEYANDLLLLCLCIFPAAFVFRLTNVFLVCLFVFYLSLGLFFFCFLAGTCVPLD